MESSSIDRPCPLSPPVNGTAPFDPSSSVPKPEPIEIDQDDQPPTTSIDPKARDDDETVESTRPSSPVADQTQVEQAKGRHEADLIKHHYEPPRAERPQDDWQVAYVWAFIVKFQLLDRIRKLECLEDFERALLEPVANRPDDILEGIFIKFLHNLKPGLRNLDPTNIQHHLSAYITDQLLSSSEFTVWDRPWAPNEEPRGPCCNEAEDREELGRLRYRGEPLVNRTRKNPIVQVEERGGGLFELDWRDRIKILRQLVDWQLSHADTIRAIIHKEYKISDSKAKKMDGIDTKIVSVPLGQDRNRARIWSFDDSARLYSSGNPFKRPCPLTSISSSKAELEALIERYRAHGALTPEKPQGSGPKGKLTGAESTAYRKLVKGIDDEKKLAEKLEEMLPAVDKEEARVAKARRKIAAAQQLAATAEFRSTRTRRSARKVDYTYGDEPFDDEDEPVSKRSRGVAAWEGSSTRGKVVIPGERRSARQALRDRDAEEYDGRSTAGDSYASRPSSPRQDGGGAEVADDETAGTDIAAVSGASPTNGYANDGES